MLFPRSLLNRWPCILHHLQRQAHSTPSSRSTNRIRFRAPKTYIPVPKPAKSFVNTPEVVKPRPAKSRSARRRSPSTLLEPEPHIPPYQKRQDISTFDPNKLISSDWIDLSNKYSQRPRLRQTYGNPGHTTSLPIYFGNVHKYPPDTKGFFYFERPDPLPHPAAGHLRFRVVPEAHPHLFSSGHDLVDPNTKAVWGKHLIHMKANLTDRHLYDALLAEGLVTPEEDRRITEMLPEDLRPRRTQVLDSILDPFIVDFSRISFQLLVVDPGRVYKIDRSHRWGSNSLGPTPSPYSGIGLCEFVILDKRKGPMHIGMRLLEYIKPPPPDAELRQQVGHLLTKYSFATRMETPIIKSADLLSEHSYRVLLDSPSHRFRM